MPSQHHPISHAARFRALLSATRQGVLIISADGSLVEANDVAARILGTDLSDLVARPLDTVTMLRPDGSVMKADERVSSQAFQRREAVSGVVMRYQREDGGDVWIEVSASPLFDDDGELWGTIATFDDLTERRRAEQALGDSERWLHTIIESLPFDVYAIGEDGRYRMQNSVCRKNWGPTIGLRPEDVTASATTRATWMRNNERAMAGETIDAEVSYELKGKTRAVHNIIAPIQDGDQIRGIIGVDIDITARKQAEDLLRAQRDLAVALSAARDRDEALDLCLQTALEVTTMDCGGIYLFDDTSGALELLRSHGLTAEFLSESSSYPPESDHVKTVLTGKPMYRWSLGNADLAAKGIREATSLQAIAVLPIFYERRVIGCLNLGSWELTEIPDQARQTLETLAAQIGGALARVDVEERLRKRDSQLRHSQKMEAIGTLAGGVAHDFNNLLQGIMGAAELVQISGRPGDPAYEAAIIIENTGQRAADLTRQLLGFVRRGKLRDVAVDIHAVVGDVAGLLKRTIDPRVRIALRLNATASTVRGDPSQLDQAIMNLAVNARDAMPEGGELTFETRSIDLSETNRDPGTGSSSGRYLVVTVADTGQGVSDEIRDRIFEPFFTTKEPGEGTGMGLSMLYGIVTNHGGWVEVRSEWGRGAAFDVYLPATSDVTPDEVVPTQKGRTGHGRILVVDDEETVRTVLSAMLSSAGYEVVTACDGEEAVTYYRDHGHEIDLVILDMSMPKLDGRACFRALEAINPIVDIIISTGHAVEGVAHDLLRDGRGGLLQKPYLRDRLFDEVERVLSR